MPARTTHHRQTLRNKIRRQRRRVSATERRRCAARLAQHLSKDPLLMNSRHIAAYLSADGEIDTWPLLESLWSLGKCIYLPVLVTFPKRRLWFSSYAPEQALVRNRFGILEPERTHYRRIRASALDLVLTPLVAFDAAGYRLGMGGGYYDRSFAFLNRRQHWRKPRMLGLAYEFQRQPLISPEPWDVPLDAIVTEQRVYHWNR